MKLGYFLVCFFFCASAQAAAPRWDELVQTSYAYLDTQQGQLESDFDLKHQERWDIDSEKGELVFSSNGVPTVVAKFQLAGSFSNESQTWMWSWANEGIGPALSERVNSVRAFGAKYDFVKLTNGHWDAQEADGWEQAAITSYLLKAKGIYSPRLANGMVFFVITDIRKAE
jgi:hypothetical protein